MNGRTERGIRLALSPGEDAPGRARHAVRERLSAWNLRDLEFQLGLLVSELVTHAIRRGARSAVRLQVEHEGAALVVSVEHDAEATPPTPPPDPRDGGHRGLLLVAALSDGWGVDQTRGGTRVWSRVDLGTAVPRARKG